MAVVKSPGLEETMRRRGALFLTMRPAPRRRVAHIPVRPPSPPCACDGIGAGTYVIHTPDGCYVGQSCVMAARWKSHLLMLRAGRHHSAKLQAAYDAHGEGSLRFERVSTDPKDEERYGLLFADRLLNAASLDPDERRRSMSQLFLRNVSTDELMAELARRGG